MNFASRSSTRLALGPGNCVCSRGSFVSVAVIISFSSWPAFRRARRLVWMDDRGAEIWRADGLRTGCALPGGEKLVDAEEVRTQLGGRETTRESLDFDA